MTRGKLKFDWSVYSARRRVTIKQLIEQKIVNDYPSFVAYCNKMSVNPLAKESFDAEMSLVTNHAVKEELHSKDLTATVWLAGVVEDDTTVNIDEKKRTFPKKKKDSVV